MTKDKKTALVTGISGQIGSYLAEELLKQGYEVHGLIRRHSVTETQTSRIDHLGDKITTHYGDVTDVSSLEKIFKEVQPDFIFNLAALSHVAIGNLQGNYCLQANTVGVLNVLETVKNVCPECRVLQSSSSEIFGNTCDDNGFQNEKTGKTPVSVYGVSKLASFHLINHYKKAYGIFACNSICFNNESSRRGGNFVTQKIVRAALNIKAGKQDKLYLGNMDSKRDWSFSGDIAKAMISIITSENPDNYVVASGETRSVREFCDIVFTKLGMDYRDYVEIDPKFLRPEELKYLCGDSSKIRKELGWKPEYSFDDLVEEMIEGNSDILNLNRS